MVIVCWIWGFFAHKAAAEINESPSPFSWVKATLHRTCIILRMLHCPSPMPSSQSSLTLPILGYW